MKFTIVKQQSIAASTVTHSPVSAGEQRTRLAIESLSRYLLVTSSRINGTFESAPRSPYNLRDCDTTLATDLASSYNICYPSPESGPVQQPQICRSCTRAYSQSASTTPQPPDFLNEAELHVFNKIRSELEPVKLEVQDISGGCGSMYAIEIVSPKFKGLTVIKQHKMVNEVLKEEIKNWHGLQLRTKAA
ncbi:uncharacterized protein yc1106_05135 [Curvularia clavata]|uniref:Bola-like protein n=1 Tax=Curvularia clavata TaxID=95742 RepID=A0A9Q8Z7J8_CURCL|nr:uncharacterized protein yc1106_05135 [Curvularia clavata]